MKVLMLGFLYSLLAALTIGCGRSSHGSGRWGFKVENHTRERFSNITVTFDGQSWETGDSVPYGGDSTGLAGDVPKAMDISFTDEAGGQHKVHVVVPAEVKEHGSDVYLVFEGRDRITAYATDPDAPPDTQPDNFRPR